MSVVPVGIDVVGWHPKCVDCPTDIEGNVCGQCPADVVFDGATMPINEELELDTTFSAPGDTCPGTFIVEIDEPQQLYAHVAGRSADVLFSSIDPKDPSDEALCTSVVSLTQQREATPGTGFVAEQTATGAGVFHDCSGGGICVGPCTDLPAIDFSESTIGAGSIRFTTPSDPNRNLFLEASTGSVTR
jgi:hypothetical protein